MPFQEISKSYIIKHELHHAPQISLASNWRYMHKKTAVL